MKGNLYQHIKIRHAYDSRVGAEGAAAPQFVGQTKSVGQYSFHSRANWLFIKLNGTNSVHFVGNSVNFVGNMQI
jgi:hypothetical protein